VLFEKGVPELLSPAFATSQPKHLTEEVIDETKRFAWFSDRDSERANGSCIIRRRDLCKFGSWLGRSVTAFFFSD